MKGICPELQKVGEVKTKGQPLATLQSQDCLKI